MIVEGTPTITIIQGDSYEREITIYNIDTSLIESIYFSCNKLGLCKKLELNENNSFILSLSSEETKKMQPIKYNYDLTIKFIDNKVNTLQYNDMMIILAKTNVVKT